MSELDASVEKLAVLLLILIFGISIVGRLFNEVHIDDEPVRVAPASIHITTSSSYAGTASISTTTTTLL